MVAQVVSQLLRSVCSPLEGSPGIPCVAQGILRCSHVLFPVEFAHILPVPFPLFIPVPLERPDENVAVAKKGPAEAERAKVGREITLIPGDLGMLLENLWFGWLSG